MALQTADRSPTANLLTTTSEFSVASSSSTAAVPTPPSNESTGSLQITAERNDVSGFPKPVKPAEDGTVRVTFVEAVITLTVNCIGAGITSFPRLAGDVGWAVAPCLCIVCAWVCYEAGRLSSLACEMVEERSGTPCSSYEALAEAAGGIVWFRILTITKNVAMLGYLVVYLRLVYESLESFVGKTGCVSSSIRFTLVYLVVLPAFGGLAMIKNLKTLAQFAMVGVLSVGLEVGSLLFGGIALLLNTPPCDSNLSPGSAGACRWYAAVPVQQKGSNKGDILGPVGLLSEMGVGLSVFLYTCAIVDTVPKVRAEVVDPKQMPRILGSSFSICTVINVIVTCIGYVGFGGNAPDNAITGLKDYYPIVSGMAATAIIVNLLISTPIYSYVVINYIESTGEDAVRTPHTVLNIICRFSMIAVLTAASDVVPHFKQVIGLVSSIFAVCSNIFFPVAFYYMLRWKAPTPTGPSALSFQALRTVVVLTVGTVVFVFGVQGSLETLIYKMSNPGVGVDCSANGATHEFTSNFIV